MRTCPQFILYALPRAGPNPDKVAYFLEALSLSYKIETIDSGTGPGTIKSDEFLRINPNGRTPALIDSKNDDFIVWESGAILYYLAEKYDPNGRFFGKTIEEKAQVMTWLAFQISGHGPIQGQINWLTHYHDWKGDTPSATVVNRYKDETKRVNSVLESRLKEQKVKGSDYIALERVTIADLAFHGWLRAIQYAKMDHDDFPTLKAYVAKLEALPFVQSANKTMEEAYAAHKTRK